MVKIASKYAIIGAVYYSDFSPSFALPIASKHDDPIDVFVQILDEPSGLIAGFTKILDINTAALIVKANIPIDIGAPYQHAFIDKRNQVYIDSAENIAAVLKIALNDPSTPLSTQAAIVDVLGIPDRGREIRAGLMRSIEAELGHLAAVGYANSAIRTKLWDILASAANGSVAAQRIRLVRAKTDAWLNDAGQVEIDIRSIDPTIDLNISVEHILSRLNDEFGGSAPEAPLSKVDLSSVGLDPTPTELLLAAQKSPRQEERLAVLIRGLLVHPEAGFSALERFSDKAQFANIAVGLLRGELSRTTEPREIELRIARLVPKFFTESFPLSRGELLYFLAAHLADFPHIRDSIAVALRRSQSMSVNRFRSEIEHLLTKRNTR